MNTDDKNNGMSHKEIKQVLKHRYPFLLVDKIKEIGEGSIVGIKNVTATDVVLEGHFPDQPIYPGVLIIEACSQVGGVLVSNKVKGNGYIAQVDSFKFMKFVEPGDTMELHAEYLKSFGPYVNVRVFAKVEGKTVAKGTITYVFKG